jgi:hypothetical protein
MNCESHLLSFSTLGITETNETVCNKTWQIRMCDATDTCELRVTPRGHRDVRDEENKNE